MARIVSLWLPRWPIQRYLITQARKAPPHEGIDPRRPFILVVDAAGGPCIAALNTAAERNGLRLQDKAADARARVAGLQVRALNPPADQAALRRLARWAGRYTPAVSVWGEENGADGFFLDVTGAAHLFGGEAELTICTEDQWLPVGRLAIADSTLDGHSRIFMLSVESLRGEGAQASPAWQSIPRVSRHPAGLQEGFSARRIATSRVPPSRRAPAEL